MGTRSRTVIFDEDLNPIVAFYRQFDGYPEGHGADLAGICAKGHLVNGFGGVQDRDNFNGMSCLAAQVLRDLKREVGGIYAVNPSEIFRWDGCGHHYEVYPDPDGTNVRIRLTMDCYKVKGEWVDGPWMVFDGQAHEAVMKFNTNRKRGVKGLWNAPAPHKSFLDRKGVYHEVNDLYLGNSMIMPLGEIIVRRPAYTHVNDWSKWMDDNPKSVDVVLPEAEASFEKRSGAMDFAAQVLGVEVFKAPSNITFVGVKKMPKGWMGIQPKESDSVAA